MHKSNVKYLILLDGAKGAGKTTTGEILVERLENVIFLSLDKERRSLPHQERPIQERNKEAFENLKEQMKAHLQKGVSIILDCGLTQTRVIEIDELAVLQNASVHRFFLKAPYPVLLERVKARDRAKGKETDEKRCEEVYGFLKAKDFTGFIILESDVLKPEEIADKIMASL